MFAFNIVFPNVCQMTIIAFKLNKQKENIRTKKKEKNKQKISKRHKGGGGVRKKVTPAPPFPLSITREFFSGISNCRELRNQWFSYDFCG